MTTESTQVIPSAAPAQPVDIPAVVAGLRKTFATGRTRPVEWRRTQLRALEQMVADNEALIAEALATDLGRKPFEAWLADIASTTAEARDAAKNVGKWTKRRHRLLERSQLPGRAWIEYEPYGTVLIIGAWNFPFALTLGPLVGALAAGNTVVLKPSELAPASSRLMAELVGAVPRLRGDRGDRGRRRGEPGTHRTGLRQAVLHRRDRDRPHGHESAAPHLTPVTLELGGKSPVIVASDADVATAAKRIAWTKLMNSGQICIAPDYVLADASVRDELVTKLNNAIRTFRAEDTGGMRIVNERHFGRLTAALAATKGEIAIGGGSDAASLQIEPTVVVDPDPGEPLMTDEIFGPILPVLTVENLDEAIRFVNSRPSRWRRTCSRRPSRSVNG